MLPLKLRCPYCHKSLIDKKFTIDDNPTVKASIEFKGKRGTVHLSSIYGNYGVESTLDVPNGESVRFLCPHCEADLSDTIPCGKCGAPLVKMSSMQGGVIKICSRRGCKKHHLEFEDLETELRAFYAEYSLFFTKPDED